MVTFRVRREAEYGLGPSRLFILEERVARSDKPSVAAEVINWLEIHFKNNINGHAIYIAFLMFFFYLGEEGSFPTGKFPFPPAAMPGAAYCLVFG